MKMTLNFFQFIDNWPESRKDQLSYKALEAIFEYLEQYEQDIGEQVEFDPIAICCDYSEYKSAWEAMEQYQPEDMPTVDEVTDADGSGDDLPTIQAKSEQLALEWLQARTTVIEFDGGIIIQQF